MLYVKETPVLACALLFLLGAVIAGLYGFAGISAASVGIAQILCGVFLLSFVIALALHLMQRRRR